MSEPRGTQEASMEEILASIRRIISEDEPPPPKAAPQAAEPHTDDPQPDPQPSDAAPAATPPPELPPLAASPPVETSPPPPPAPESIPPPPSAPTAVWGIVGDQPASDGEELVLTQMLAEDGSVVALDRPAGDGAASPLSTWSADQSTSQPLDVLLLTDALPPSVPETEAVAAPPEVPVTQQAPVAPPPIPADEPASSPSAPLWPTLSRGPQRAASGLMSTGPTASQAPAPPALPGENDPVGLASPETLIQSSAALSQLARTRARDGVLTLEDLVRQSLEPKIQEWLNANLQDIVERLVQLEIDRISRRAE